MMSLRSAIKEAVEFLRSDTTADSLGYGDTKAGEKLPQKSRVTISSSTFAEPQIPKIEDYWQQQSVYESIPFNVKDKIFSYDTWSDLGQDDAVVIQTQINQLIQNLPKKYSEFLHTVEVVLSPKSLIGVVRSEGSDSEMAGFWLANPSGDSYEFLIVVSSSFQGQGIASALVDVASKYLLAKGIKNVIVKVEATNIQVHKLIDKMINKYHFNIHVVSKGYEQTYQIQLES